MRELYDRILTLSDEDIWVPAIGNGALRNLLEEMVERGWRIIPPTDGKSIPDRLREEARRMLQEGNLEQQAALMWAADLVEKEEQK